MNKRLQAAIELGLLYGFLTWILGTGVSNRIPGWGVWLIILDRVLIAGILYYMVDLDYPKWIKGVAAGLALSIPIGWAASQWPYFTAVTAWGGALGTGILAGVLMAFSIARHKDAPEDAVQAKN